MPNNINTPSKVMQKVVPITIHHLLEAPKPERIPEILPEMHRAVDLHALPIQ